MFPRLPFLALLVALGGCNLVAYDILASGRDLTPADGGSSGERCDLFLRVRFLCLMLRGQDLQRSVK